MTESAETAAQARQGAPVGAQAPRFPISAETAARARQGRRWERRARAYKAERPLCAHCEAEGFYRPAEEVHHIHALRMGGALLDERNLLGLCARHHRLLDCAEQRWIAGERVVFGCDHEGNALLTPGGITADEAGEPRWWEKYDGE